MNIRNTLIGGLGAIIMLGTLATGVFAAVNAVTPSTNDINRANGWAHVDQVSQGVGTTDLQFISTRAFYSCFEYRVDNEPNTVAGPNPNSSISDGRWTQVCVKNSTSTVTIPANEFVDVRMVYGAETDERFDWTRFDVLYDRNAMITSPLAGSSVSGNVNFTAYLDDNEVDNIQWAVREGTCAANTGTVFGNVDGHSDVATVDQSDLSHQTFSFTGDMSSMTPGSYCFVYNPVEDDGESDIRLTSTFIVEDPYAVPVACQGIDFEDAPIIGTSGNDRIRGTAGNDLIFTLGGNDRVDGGAGNDCIVTGDGNDRVDGGSGNDVILAGLGNDRVDGGSGNDLLYGDAGNDNMKGGAGYDKLYGEAGDDKLYGGSGNDLLDGGDDIDKATGDSGIDTCIAETVKKCEL